MHSVIILSQGEEVITGQVVDTNAAWLATELTSVGFSVVEHTSVGDKHEHLVALFQRVAGQASLVICTGGLGPTADDLTADAAAEAFSKPLFEDQEALRFIEELYRKNDRIMPSVNRRQARRPQGSRRIDNKWGTAPGFIVEHLNTQFVFLPGVPREMKAMFSAFVLPSLLEIFQMAPSQLITLSTLGIGESGLQELIGAFHEEDVTLSFRTDLPYNHVKLRFLSTTSLQRRRAVVLAMLERIGPHTYTVAGADDLNLTEVNTSGQILAVIVLEALKERKQVVCTIESCTGGRIAAALTAVPGSSAAFHEALITYSNEAKHRQCGVSYSLLEEHGAVSEPVVRQMLRGGAERCESQWAVAVSGIAGPSGATPTKPVGTVVMGVLGPNLLHVQTQRFPGDRNRVQQQATATALEMLRRALQN